MTERAARIATLVAQLGAIEEELLELTGGQVDAVVGPGDGAYLLRGAQRELAATIERERAHARRQTAILDALAANVALVDGSGVIVAVNRSWRQFGDANGLCDPDHDVGRSYLAVCDEALGPEITDAARVAEALRAVLSGARARFEHEYPCHAPDRQRWFRVTITPLSGEASGGAVVMHVDITERVEAEQRLAEHAALLDKAHDAIVVRDLDGRTTFLNHRAELLYGWSRDEAMGRDVRELQFAGFEASFDVANTATIERGEWSGELSQVCKDGHTVLTSGRWTLVRGQDGVPRSILAINTDISEQKRTEQQLMRAQRMESIGTLAGGIAHDLNNVLAPILMSIGLMRTDEVDPQRLEDLTTIEQSAKRGAEMVRQLLSFARGVDGSRMQLDLRRTVAEVSRVIRDTFPKNLQLSVASVPDLWPVSADPTQMHQVLINLCVNARDAMPGGGSLAIGLDNVVIDEVYAGMNPHTLPGDYVRIRVEDDGTGMSPEVLERAFEPFFTTKVVGEGTGLGLSTTHAIVRSHGGVINIYSEVGHGTQFHVYIPALTNAEASEEVALAQTRLPRGRGEQILVVDDEEAIRTMAERTLTRFGYRVRLAAHGAEAIAIFAREQDGVDLVLTDMAMPVMDGPATVVALRAISPSVRIVGSSGLDADGRLAKATGAGLRHFISKPYTAETMLRKLREVLDE